MLNYCYLPCVAGGQREFLEGGISKPTVTHSHTSGLSLKVNQSGISEVLTKYKRYLKEFYNARPLALADKYLPTLEAPYINLAMIESKPYDPQQKDLFTKRTLHGGVDQILQSKTPFSMVDLFSSNNSSKPVRFILVEGPPGIGKSTFAWELCRRWDEINGLKDYHAVVLLRLREKWVLNATSISDLFRYPQDPEFSKQITEELCMSHGHKVLLVLDGFDEISHSFHGNSIVKDILCKQVLPACTIVLTILGHQLAMFWITSVSPSLTSM